MQLRKLRFLLFLLFLLPSVASAQQTAKDSLRQAFDEFILNYQQLIDTHKVEKVTQFFDESLRTTVVTSDIRSRVRVFHNSFKQFGEFLGKLAFSPGLHLKYEVEDVLQLYTTGRFGYVVYQVNYELNQEGSIWNKGNETVTLSYQKIGGKWKIIHFTTVIFEDEKLRGRCYAKIYAPKEAAEKNEYLASVVVPSGEAYSEESYTFEFNTRENERAILAEDQATGIQQEFRWKYSNEEIWELSDSGLKQEVLGTAKARQEAIIIILREHFHEDNCSSMRLRK
ncbi:MAG: hypothetical protein AAF740_09765 [Bacteroidota bacterium]